MGSQLKSTKIRKIYENNSGRFPEGGGPQRGNLTMTTSTTTARRKGDPRYYLEERRKRERCQKGILVSQGLSGPLSSPTNDIFWRKNAPGVATLTLRARSS